MISLSVFHVPHVMAYTEPLTLFPKCTTNAPRDGSRGQVRVTSSWKYTSEIVTFTPLQSATCPKYLSHDPQLEEWLFGFSVPAYRCVNRTFWIGACIVKTRSFHSSENWVKVMPSEILIFCKHWFRENALTCSYWWIFSFDFSRNELWVSFGLLAFWTPRERLFWGWESSGNIILRATRRSPSGVKIMW